jgi:endonuclease-8
MPEGPSIVIAKEELAPFVGKKILGATGNAKIELERLSNKKIMFIKSWGKHLLICLSDFFIRIHFMMFGSYRINEKKENQPRLTLKFKNGEINFYTCSIRLIEGNADEKYDWRRDVMSDLWDASLAKKSLARLNKVMIADALLNQEIFSGVGNIIKNEVLFRIRVHPASVVRSIPTKKVNEIVKEARQYSFDFYEWKKIFQLRKHWLIYKKKICPRCDIPFIREYLGTTKRLTFYCNNCQIQYPRKRRTLRSAAGKLTA